MGLQFMYSRGVEACDSGILCFTCLLYFVLNLQQASLSFFASQFLDKLNFVDREILYGLYKTLLSGTFLYLNRPYDSSIS